MEGIELKVHNKIISVPFIEDGVLSILVTANRGRITINFGGMTESTEMLDYYVSEMEPEDCINISLKEIEQVTEPINRRMYASCHGELATKAELEAELKWFLILEKELIEEGLISKR